MKLNQGALNAIVECIGYLKATKDYCIGCPTTCESWWWFGSDSDHAGNSEAQNKLRSQCGYIGVHRGMPTIWKSTISKIAFAMDEIGEGHVDRSTGAVEIYAAVEATYGLLAYRHQVDEMHIGLELPIKLHVDATTAISFMNDTAKRSKLKHIDVRQQWVIMLRDKDLVVPVHIEPALNLADILTKILGPIVFCRLRDS